jgi:hypothetical protein
MIIYQFNHFLEKYTVITHTHTYLPRHQGIRYLKLKLLCIYLDPVMLTQRIQLESALGTTFQWRDFLFSVKYFTATYE